MSTLRKITYMAVYSAERYAKLAAAGLCVRCKGSATPGMKMCEPCRVLVRDRLRAKYRTSRGIPLTLARWARA